VGFSGQMHGSTLLDAQDQVVRPALLWCDQRTGAECEAITATVGAARPHRADAQPGPHRLHPAQAAVGAAPRTRALGARPLGAPPKDYVRFRLTGERATDVADASGTLLFDVANRRWSAEVAGASTSTWRCCRAPSNRRR
jgi:xylulokinase